MKHIKGLTKPSTALNLDLGSGLLNRIFCFLFGVGCEEKGGIDLDKDENNTVE